MPWWWLELQKIMVGAVEWMGVGESTSLIRSRELVAPRGGGRKTAGRKTGEENEKKKEKRKEKRKLEGA